MDPEANLARQRELVARLFDLADDTSGDKAVEFTAAAVELAELADALDRWLSNGGFMPRVWDAFREPSQTGIAVDDLKAILAAASRWNRQVAASYPQDGPHATRDNCLRLAAIAENTRV